MIPLVLMLLALGLRSLFVPIHLAEEEHVGIGGSGHPHSHGLVEEEHVAGDHHHHDHDDGHQPHPETDHTSELIVERAPSPPVWVDPPELPSSDPWFYAARDTFSTIEPPEIRPPQTRPRPASPSRGPPAAA